MFIALVYTCDAFRFARKNAIMEILEKMTFRQSNRKVKYFAMKTVFRLH